MLEIELPPVFPSQFPAKHSVLALPASRVKTPPKRGLDYGVRLSSFIVASPNSHKVGLSYPGGQDDD